MRPAVVLIFNLTYVVWFLHFLIWDIYPTTNLIALVPTRTGANIQHTCVDNKIEDCDKCLIKAHMPKHVSPHILLVKLSSISLPPCLILLVGSCDWKLITKNLGILLESKFGTAIFRSIYKKIIRSIGIYYTLEIIIVWRNAPHLRSISLHLFLLLENHDCSFCTQQ